MSGNGAEGWNLIYIAIFSGRKLLHSLFFRRGGGGGGLVGRKNGKKTTPVPCSISEMKEEKLVNLNISQNETTFSNK